MTNNARTRSILSWLLGGGIPATNETCQGLAFVDFTLGPTLSITRQGQTPITTPETLLTEEDKSPISNIKYDLLSALYCFIMEWRVMTGAGRSHTVQS